VIKFVDYCVDGRSFEARLRDTFPDLYSRGRYRETQVPTLVGGLDDRAKVQEVIDNLLPPEGQSRTCLIYGCHDGCCAYAYIEVQHRDDLVAWTRFGLNAAYTGNAKGASTGVEWLVDFEPLYFALDEYQAMMESFEAKRTRNAR
jgi:hypothetical protein